MNTRNLGKWYYVLLFAIVVSCAGIYIQTADFSFIRYDDDVYILDNPDIRDLSSEGVKKIFLNPDKPEEMKPPVTVLSFAVNYAAGGLNPRGYKLFNLILHLLNTVLVFGVVTLYTSRRDIALFAAGVFALHPSSAEVVAWATARKDLLYSFFYLLALVCSFKYWKSGKIYFYVFTLLCFILSYYSKYAAASFPVLFLALGVFYVKSKNMIRTVVESVPFFIPPLYSFYLSVSGNPDSAPVLTKSAEEITPLNDAVVQSVSAARDITVYDSFNLLQKIFLGGYSFIQYLIKFIFPVNQQLIYPYPPIDESGNLPFEYYAFTGLSLLIVGLLVYLFVKRKNLIQNEFGFGALVFGTSVALLLHVLPIGGRAVIADRYLYLPIIGLSVMLYYLMLQAAEKFNLPKLPKIASVIFLLLLFVKLSDRIPDWKNTETIFTDLIEKEDRTAIPHNNLGNYYEERGRRKKALDHLNSALKINPNYLEALNNRGTVLLNTGNEEQALIDFKRIIDSKPNYTPALYNAGTAFEAMEMYDSALYYYDRAIKSNSNFYKAFNNYGAVLMDYKKEYDEAEKYFRKAIQIKGDFARAHNNLGIVYRVEHNDVKGALKHFKTAVEFEPDFIDGYLNIARIYMDQDRLNDAAKMLNFIISKNPDYSFAYFHLGIVQLKSGQGEAGCQNLKTAYQKGFQQAEPYILNYCRRDADTMNK